MDGWMEERFRIKVIKRIAHSNQKLNYPNVGKKAIQMSLKNYPISFPVHG